MSEKQDILPDTPIQSDEMSLKEIILKIQELWKYLLSKWLIILVSGAIGSSIGLVYAISNKVTYTAELTFALEDATGGAGGLGGALGLASQFGVDLGSGGGGAFSGDNLLLLMKSRTMVEKALLSTVNVQGVNLTLAELYISFNGLRKVWENNPELNEVHFLPNADRSKFTLKQDSILGLFHRTIIGKNLSVEKMDKKLSIIEVKVRSESELFSKSFSEVLVKEVSDFYVDTKTKKSTINLVILQHQTDSVRRALNFAILGVASSVDANPNANPARQILLAPSRRRTVEVQANQAILIELVKNLEIAKISVRKETPLIQIIDSPILPLEIEQYGKKKGVFIGGIIGGFIAIIFISVKKLLSDLLEI